MNSEMSTGIVLESGPPKRRHRRGLKRVQVACERCRTRKLKCDGQLPSCQTCNTAGARCVYIDRLTGSARERTDELEKEIARLQQRVRELETVPNDTDGYPQAEQLPNPLISPSASTHNGTIADEVETVARGMASDRKYVGESSGAFFGRVLHSVLLQSHYKLDQGRRRLPPHLRTENARPPSTSPVSLPSVERAKLLRDRFVQHRWVSYPCLHMPTFDAQHLSRVCADGYDAHPVSLFLVLMVFALGSSDLEQDGVVGIVSHHDYFITATNRYLATVIGEDNENAVQSLILLGVYSMHEAHRSPNAWHVAGQAVRMAIDLGFHRVSVNTELREAELRKRMFWSAYCLDRNVSVALGRPFAIRDEDIAISLPLNLSDTALDTGTSMPGNYVLAPPSTTVEDTEPGLSTFIHIVRIRQLQSRVQKTFYPVSTCSLSHEALLTCQRQLAIELDDWLRDAPIIRNGSNNRASEWPSMAHSHTLLLIYRPNPAKPTASPEALRICADSALTIITSYASMYAKNKMIHTWIALHSIFQSAITMLYTLWVSPEIRRSTRKAILRNNVNTVLALFDALDGTWPVASRCREIIENLGNATYALFDCPTQPGEDSTTSNAQAMAITAEFMGWLNAQPEAPDVDLSLETPYEYTQQIELPEQFPMMQNLDDLFFQDFGVAFPGSINGFNGVDYQFDNVQS